MAAAPSDKQASGEESPTTARPIDFDDEPQETGIVHDALPQSPSPSASAVQQATTSSHDEEEAPPKPPRPQSPLRQAEATLVEAFPNIEAKVVKAVLMASGGQVEPAFNALLGMSDPDAQIEVAPPPQPPRPSRQVQQDELYARQLADHYRNVPSGYAARGLVSPPEPRMQKRSGPTFDQAEKERSFIDDDLPVIRENVRQGFLQTQSKVNKWISDFRKKIDGEEGNSGTANGQSNTQSTSQPYGDSYRDQHYDAYSPGDGPKTARRSTDQDRYDSDPRVLSDNFTELEMRDEEEVPPKKPSRPLANPNLFKPTPLPPQTGPVDEVEAAQGQISPPAGKSKKWQPLTSVAPDPEADDNDPFSLGDSDEERDSKTKEIRSADADRLKQAASATTNATSNTGGKVLEASEQAGSTNTRNKDAEKLLNEKS